MKKYFKWIKISDKWNNFHLADKCLLIIMVILMIQTAHNLFFHEFAIQDSAVIDVVVRTTAAAIFGYFISANFQNSYKDISQNKYENTNSVDIKYSIESESLTKSKIGFNTDLAAHELNSGYTSASANDDLKPNNTMQIIIVATIGITCLIFLLIARNYSTINAASIATVSQLRDFISGSIGFLIGQSTHYKKS